MTTSSLTVIFLTFNEEKNLDRGLRSVAGLAERVIVVDSGSTDGTVAIAKRFGAEVAEHPFTTQAAQFNWALDHMKIASAWVLRLDADEYLTPALTEEIRREIVEAAPGTAGFQMKRRVHFMGRWIRHGGYYPTWLLRLFRRGTARSDDRAMDEHIFITEGDVGKLKNDFVDDNRKGLSDWIAKHNAYASREAEAAFARQAGSRGQKKGFYYRLPPFLRVFCYFFYRYVVRGGFLDGIPGLVFHFLQGFWYRFLVDAKLYEKGHLPDAHPHRQ